MAATIATSAAKVNFVVDLMFSFHRKLHYTRLRFKCILLFNFQQVLTVGENWTCVFIFDKFYIYLWQY